LNPSVTRQDNQDVQSQLTLDDKLSKKSKSRRKKANRGDNVAKNEPVRVDPNDKFLVFSQVVRQGDQEFMQERKGKDPYEYINKKT
jgi:hypothetical protein